MDLSAELNDEHDWKAGTLRTFDHHLDITAWAYEPLSHLLAIGSLSTLQDMLLNNILNIALLGTSSGIIDLFGGPGVEHRLHVTDRAHVRSLHFASSCFKLICIGIPRLRTRSWDVTNSSF